MAKVAIIGAGLVGRAWIISFARAGHDVAVTDADPKAIDNAFEFIGGALEDLARYDLLNGAAPRQVRTKISRAESLTAAVDGAVHVQENTPERLDLKRKIFSELDRLAAPDCVIASSTSALLPSRFTDGLAGRNRCLVAHPINPPYLVPAVEITPAPWTDDAITERTRRFMAEAGHAPFIIKREIDGFVVNRLQGALLQEAFRLVADGYVSADEVDIAIREGLALRWSFMGPFETIDLNAPGGVRDYVARYAGLYEELFETQKRRADWRSSVLDKIERERRQRVPEGALGERQAWRDRRLMALIAHKRRAAKEIGD